jgi:GDPmannose 4,6-dehydratase
MLFSGLIYLFLNLILLRVVGLVRYSSLAQQYYPRLAHFQHRLTLVFGDLLDQSSLNKVIRDVNPDEVYNLAALSFVHTSFVQPETTGSVTGLGVTR